MCLSSTQVRQCFTPTGGGQPTPVTYDCLPGTACQIVSGRAQCVLIAPCLSGATRCANATTLETCVTNAWASANCPNGCTQSVIGAGCVPLGVTLGTYNGSLKYEVRGVKADRTDWSPTTSAVTAAAILVLSYHGSDVVDATYTKSDGSFVVKTATPRGPTDILRFVAAAADFSGSISFAVVDPGLAPGHYPTSSVSGSSPTVWGWNTSPLTGLAGGETWTITEALFSGAVRVFDYLRYVHNSSGTRWPSATRTPLIVWLGKDVSWDNCGACFSARPVHVGGNAFGSQIYMPGSTIDSEWWADAVTAHELGHWAMWQFGRRPGEGGKHCFGIPVPAGMAWSEGWATWFSADARSNPVYIDKQGGSMFWLDVSTRQSSKNVVWQRPMPADGLFQFLDENEVAAMLWQLSSVLGLTHSQLDAALASPRMKMQTQTRGYYRHVWAIDSNCSPINVTKTSDPSLMVADFFDALVCGGVPASTIDAATLPGAYYPYNPLLPKCSPKTPLVANWQLIAGRPARDAKLTLRLRLERRGRWPFPINVSLRLPRGVTLLQGARRRILAADPRVGSVELDYLVQIDQWPVGDLVAVVDSQAKSAGVHAEPHYRFGRPLPAHVPLRRSGPRLRIGGRDFGRAIQLPPPTRN